MKKIYTLIFIALVFSTLASAQITETPLFTGEKSPEAFSYYDLLGWVKTDAAIVGKYVNFGTAEAPVNISLVDNPDKTGVNKTDKALILKSLVGKSW